MIRNEESDEEFGLKKAFEVPDDDHFDPDEAPKSGLEYLRRVMYETSQCPGIVVVKIDPAKIKDRINPAFQTKKVGMPMKKGFSPDETWQSEQIANFSRLRLEISSHRSDKINVSTKSLPSTSYGWCKFCYGESAAERLVTANRKEGELDGEKRLELEESGTRPLLSIVLSFSQTVVEILLEYNYSWLEANSSFSVYQGEWIYSLMACVEKPLTSSLCSILRNICRVCQKKRLELDSPTDPLLAPLNVIITLVTRYFDQIDLEDD